MIVVFIVIIVAVVILALVFLFAGKGKYFLFNQNSIVADAIVLNIQLTGVCIKDDIQAIIQLQVQPERGKSFVADIKEMLSASEYTKLHPGTRVIVNYNSRNYKEMVILKESLSPAFKFNETVYKSI